MDELRSTVELMIMGVSKLTTFKGVITRAQKITMFIYNHHKTLVVMRQITDKKKIVRPELDLLQTS